MACYLSVVPNVAGAGLECEGCAREIASPLVAWTDEVGPGKPGQLVPLCPVCLQSLDLILAGLQQFMSDAAQLAPGVFFGCQPPGPPEPVH